MNWKNFVWRWVPVVAWCGLIFYLSSIPHLAINDGVSDLVLRKTAHMAEYAILLVLFYRAIARDWRVWHWSIAGLSLLFTILYAATDEWHQHYVIGRHGATIDVFIDAAGMVLGLAFLAWWSWWNRSLAEAAPTLPTSQVVTRDQLRQLASQTAASLKGGEVLALRGDLGAGKTTFTQDLAAALGVTSSVSSPTFGLQKQYQLPDGKQLHHFDWYRLDGADQVADLGMAEIWLQPQTITVIEWPERALELLPPQTIFISLEHVDAETRRITINS